jgi:hypothetical protein
LILLISSSWVARIKAWATRWCPMLMLLKWAHFIFIYFPKNSGVVGSLNASAEKVLWPHNSQERRPEVYQSLPHSSNIKILFYKHQGYRL